MCAFPGSNLLTTYKLTVLFLLASPGSKSVISSLKDRVSQENSGLNSESKVPSRVFQMLQKQLEDDQLEGIVYKWPCPFMQYAHAPVSQMSHFTSYTFSSRHSFCFLFYALPSLEIFHAHAALHTQSFCHTEYFARNYSGSFAYLVRDTFFRITYNCRGIGFLPLSGSTS